MIDSTSSAATGVLVINNDNPVVIGPGQAFFVYHWVPSSARSYIELILERRITDAEYDEVVMGYRTDETAGLCTYVPRTGDKS